MSDDEIKDAYHHIVRSYHPDRLAGLGVPADLLAHGVEMLKKINAAYDTTIARERRAKATAA